MFRGLIDDARLAAASLIAKYPARASVAVPFIAALGFATAATAAMLVDRFGAVDGYWIVTGGFTLIGLVAGGGVTGKEGGGRAADQRAQNADTAEVAADALAQPNPGNKPNGARPPLDGASRQAQV